MMTRVDERQILQHCEGDVVEAVGCRENRGYVGTGPVRLMHQSRSIRGSLENTTILP